jgi:hypothetical protein
MNRPADPRRRTTAVTSILRGALVIATDVLRRHSLTFSAAALLATYLAKIFWYIDRLSLVGRLRMQFLAFLADDLFFWAVMIALFWVLEAAINRRWVRIGTTCLALCLALLAILNVFWIRGTGGQLSLAVVQVGLFRTAEVIPIIEAGLGTKGIVLLAFAILLPVAIPFLFKTQWNRLGYRVDYIHWPTIGFPLCLGLLGLIGLAERSHPDAPGWRLLADNVHLAGSTGTGRQVALAQYRNADLRGDSLPRHIARSVGTALDAVHEADGNTGLRGQEHACGDSPYLEVDLFCALRPLPGDAASDSGISRRLPDALSRDDPWGLRV